MILADHHNHACIQGIAGITGGVPQYKLEIDAVRLPGVAGVQRHIDLGSQDMCLYLSVLPGG